MNTPSSAVRARGLIVLFLLSATSAHGVSLVVETNPPITELKLLPPGGVFPTTTATVTEAALIEVANTTTLLMRWKETVGAGSPVPYYALSFDNGANVSRVRRTSYTFKLGGDEFDPLATAQPEVPVSISERVAVSLVGM